MAEIEDTINRIKKNQNLGFMITDRHHKIIRSNLIGENAPKVSSKGRTSEKQRADANQES